MVYERTKKLEKSLEKIHQISKLKLRFLATMSHGNFC